MNSFYNNNTGLYTFYLLYTFSLFGLLLFLTNPNGLLSESVRIVFLALSLLPLFFNKNLAFFTLVPLLCVSLASFCPVLPTSSVYYLFIVPLLAFFFIRIELDAVLIHTLLVLVYFLLIGLLYGDNVSFVFWASIGVVLIGCIKDKTDVDFMNTAFMMISIGICLLYLFYSQFFLVKIASDAEGGFERAQWLNPNELAGMINCGGIIATGLLTGFFKHSIKSRWFLVLEILTIILVAIVNVINASRGGTFIFIIMVLMFSLLGKTRSIYKIGFAIGLVLLVYFIYNEGYLETLFYRINDDSLYTANGRFRIWTTKLNAFWGGDFSSAQQLFGIGLMGSINIGPVVRTHNDFITALIGFGFVGLFLFLSVFVVMIKNTRPQDRAKLLVLLLFVLLESSSLEFFFRGYLSLLLLMFFSYRYFSIVSCKDYQ